MLSAIPLQLRARAQRFFSAHGWVQPSHASTQYGSQSLVSSQSADMDVLGGRRLAGNTSDDDTPTGAKLATPHVARSRAAPQYVQGSLRVKGGVSLSDV